MELIFLDKFLKHLNNKTHRVYLTDFYKLTSPLNSITNLYKKIKKVKFKF